MIYVSSAALVAATAFVSGGDFNPNTNNAENGDFFCSLFPLLIHPKQRCMSPSDFHQLICIIIDDKTKEQSVR